MYKIAVFGAGQAGQMAASWIPAGSEFLCFIDNNEEKHGTSINGTPVLSLENALLKEPDEIIAAIVRKEALDKIEIQLDKAGYKGKRTFLRDISRVQDIRISALRLSAEEIKKRGVPGDIAELGVYKGEFARQMSLLLPDRRLWLFDTFSGFDGSDLDKEEEITGERPTRMDFKDTGIEEVRSVLPYPDKAEFVCGLFPGSITERAELTGDDIRFALVSLDPDLYAPTYEGLSYFYPRMSPGGRIIIHDYNSFQFRGVKKAVDEYCSSNNLFPIPLMDVHGTALLVKP